MSKLSLVLSLLMSCSGDEPPPVRRLPVEAPEPVVEDPEEQLTGAEQFAISGRHADVIALPDADAELVARETAHTTDTSVWEQFQQARLRSDRTAAGTLAASASASADEQDAMNALLVLDGVEVAAIGPLTALAKDEAPEPDSAPIGEGWLVSAVRSEILYAQGDLEGSRTEAEAAFASDKVAGSLWRAQAALLGRADPSEAAVLVRTMAEQAIEDADGGTLRKVLSLLVDLRVQGEGVDKALEEVTALHQAVLEAYGDTGTGVTSIFVAELAVRSGRLQRAQEAVALARVALEGDASLSDVVWLEGWVAYQLGEREALQIARDGASGGHQQALDAFVSMSEGLPPAEIGPQVAEVLSDWELALFHTEFAQLSGPFAERNLRAAIAAADRSGAMSLRVYTRLAAESAARTNGIMDAAAIRSDVRDLFSGEIPENLQFELSVRALLDGEAQELPAADGILGVWSALSAGKAPPDAGEDIWYAGLSDWASGRAQMTEEPAAAAGALQSALGALPTHRQGVLRIGTVLDGSQGLNLGRDLALLEGAEEDETVALALAVHELAHRYEEIRLDVVLGRELTRGLPTEQRQALRTATVRARVELRQFMLGGDFPNGVMEELAEAEASAAAFLPFKRSAPTSGMTLTELRTKMDNVCLLSYVEVDGRLSGLAISPSSGMLLDVGSSAELYDLMAQYRSFMEQSADEISSMGKNVLGNTLRLRLIDPFSRTLTGFGNYLFLSGNQLVAAPLLTFPEQAASLRYLADIRTVSHGASLRGVYVPFESEEAYKPEFLGIGNPKAPPLTEEPDEDTAEEEAAEKTEEDSPPGAEADEGAEPESPEFVEEDIPLDMKIVVRHFSEPFFRYQVGEGATRKSYIEHGPTARYLYISNVPATVDGGFRLVDGELTLSEVRANPLMADVVFINASAPHVLQMHRVRAFLDAGAQAVAVVNWLVPEPTLETMVDSFFRGVVQGQKLPLAFADARSKVLKKHQQIDENFTENPALWGAVTLHGSW